MSIVILTYHGKTVKDLPHLGSVEEQQYQVFEHYVMRMLELQTKRKWHHTSYQTCKWLVWLAQEMKQHHLTEFYLEHLQPSWLLTKRLQNAYCICSTIGFGLIFGLIFGLLGGLVGGLVFGLLGGLYSLGRWKIQLSETLTWSWKLFWKSLSDRDDLVVGLVGGLAAWLSSGIADRLSDAQINEHLRLRPNQGIQASGLNALRSGLVCGLLVGLVVGLVVGLLYGGLTYLQHYLLLFMLWRSRVMPWHSIRFLVRGHRAYPTTACWRWLPLHPSTLLV